MNEKSNKKAPLLDPCGNIIDSLPTERVIQEGVTSGAFNRGFADAVSAVATEAHVVTSGGRVVPTHVVRGFSKPKALFDDVAEEYEEGFYPTLELTSGVEVRVGKFCDTLEESEGIITVILAEVRRKAATY